MLSLPQFFGILLFAFKLPSIAIYCIYGLLAFETTVVVIGAFRYRHLDVPLRWLYVFIVLWLMTSLYSAFLSSHGVRNLWVSHLSRLASGIIFAVVYYRWRTGFRGGMPVLFGLLLFVGVWIYETVVFNAFYYYGNISASAENIYEIAICLIVLIQVFTDERVTHWNHDPRFWTSSAFILYNSGTFFLFALFQKIVQIPPEKTYWLLVINWSLTLVFFLMTLRAFWCAPAPSGLIESGEA
jgi:hypothetical protein